MAVKNIFTRRQTPSQQEAVFMPPATTEPEQSGVEKGYYDDESKVPFLTARTFFMAVLVSMGGICFGYDTGMLACSQYL